MKKLVPFISGVLCTTLVCSLTISGLAISGRMTIEVDPVNVQVNGEVFAPTDVNGKEVPVFAYQGTTYAPLRALAEAYGLEVGYDAAANMATVTDPEAQPAEPDTTTNVPDYSDWSAEDEAAYQEWKGLWEISIYENKHSNETLLNLRCNDTEQEVDKFLSSHSVEFIEKICLRLDGELHNEYGLHKMAYFFMLRGPWGWMDMLTSDGWVCGVRDIVAD